MPILTRLIGCGTTMALAMLWLLQTGCSSQTTDNPNDDIRLSDEQIARFVTEVEGAREGERVVFSANFRPRVLSPAERERFARSGKIPFQITADYQEHKPDRNNRLLRRRLSGRINFHVLNSEGTVIDRRQLAVERLCPS